MSELSDALTRAGFPADTPTTRLAGLTNVNHLLEHDGRKYVLRLPGAAAHALEQQRQGFRQFPFFALDLQNDPGVAATDETE